MKRSPISSIIQFSSLFLTTKRVLQSSSADPSHVTPRFHFFPYATATYSTICQAQPETSLDQPNSSTQVLKRWGCTDADIKKIFHRAPSIKKANPDQLQSKLNLLKGLGVESTGLVKMIHCRPRLLGCRLSTSFDKRLEYFMWLFGSREVLAKAIVRNPSLLTYDLHDKIKPAIELYEKLGVSKEELVVMLLSRPTLIPRTSFDEEKMEYIRKAGVVKGSKMYKYIVTLIGISRVETLREKAGNFEKFGFSEEEIWSLFGKNPLVLTLSVDKVQRNMTFVVGVMKLPAKVVFTCPFLLFHNLEAVLKPRVLLGEKIEDLGLRPRIKGKLILRAIRMKEKRFLNVFVLRHPKDVAEELMEFYRNAKGFKRLAEASKKNVRKGFPF